LDDHFDITDEMLATTLNSATTHEIAHEGLGGVGVLNLSFLAVEFANA
jgi:hypothetical protein